jgi:two-component system copper resistance phosphate regulon response regulator CusR
MRILLAEDEDQLRDTLARGLREQAYAVDTVANGEDAVYQAAVTDYDAVILDVLMPKRSGLDACREIRRRRNHVPILMLTARDALADRVTGLDAGADDYLTKPFEFDELLARLRALMRRRGEVLPATIVVADLEIDTNRHRARRGDRVIPLTSKEYAILELVARRAGSIVPRTEISAHAWDDNHDPMSNLLEVYMSRLRRKIDAGESVQLLHTRRGAGYMLGLPDEDADDADDDG